MAGEYHHGVNVVEINNGTQTIRTIATAVIGIVCTSKDADNKTFPLNTPVLLHDLPTAIGKAGTSGTLAPSLTAISNQVSAPVVVVRVEEDTKSPSKTDGGKDADSKSGATDTLKANVIGTTTSAGKKTGLQALLTAQSTLGVTPRILGVPGIADSDVTAALASIAQQIKGFAYAVIDAENVQAASLAREDFGSRELMLIYGDFTGFDVATSKEATISSVAVALGLRARTDQEVGWHRCLSNLPVNGVTGVTKPVSWDLQNSNTDADELNSHDITALIQKSGYRFWGVRTCDASGKFAFESYTRTAQVLAQTIAEAHFSFIDKPLTPMTARDIIDGVNAKLRTLKTQGYILGGEAWIDEKRNGAEEIKGGKLIINYKYTPVPPLESLGFEQEITDTYLADFAAQVNA
ncbi:phage tail sheath subtilisin-like domain-containing protein [Carnimonas bestiolae]|uniref:phage tail sheath subtilisin-like domain-containing protein n=1 Tax=Carnimonas bestiolae TaxID=3402172 RepID=UPI003EDCA806